MIRVDGLTNRRNKVAFSNFCDGVASPPGGSRNTPSRFMLQKQGKLRPDGPLDSYTDLTPLTYPRRIV